MDTTDAKRLSPEAQAELRKQIIRLRKKGVSNKETAEILGLSVSNCSRVWQKYQREGTKGISLKQRGRKTGEKRRLTPEQEKEIQGVIAVQTPEQLHFAFALWTREAIGQLIRRMYNIDLPLKSISNYLKRWGFTAQRPIHRAYEQDPVKVQKWMDEEYPRIQQKAREEGAEIYWGDETGIQNSAYRDKGFAPKGQTPVLRLQAKREKISMISAITNRGKVRFMIYDEAMNAKIMIDFMKRLVKDAKRKVYLIVDNLRVHHSKVVKAWLAEHQDQIEVFYLPSYSPEKNPDEYLNNDLKRNVHSGLVNRTKEDLKKKTRSFMRRLQRMPDHVASYFRHPQLTYIRQHV